LSEQARSSQSESQSQRESIIKMESEKEQIAKQLAELTSRNTTEIMRTTDLD